MKLWVEWIDVDHGEVKVSGDPEGDEATLCGLVRWSGDEWLYQGEDETTTTAIHVDPEQTEEFRRERLRILRDTDEVLKSALLAEFEGRLRLFRDESRGLAEIGARVEAKRWMKRSSAS